MRGEDQEKYVERLKQRNLIERSVRNCLDCWHSGGSKKVLIARFHSGFAAYAAEPSVTLPVDFQDAIAENFLTRNPCIMSPGRPGRGGDMQIKMPYEAL